MALPVRARIATVERSSIAACALLLATSCANRSSSSYADGGPRTEPRDAATSRDGADGKKAEPPCPAPPDPSACDDLLATAFEGSNPSGAWSYGWAASLGRPFTPFTTLYRGTDAAFDGAICWSSAELVDPRGAHVPAVCEPAAATGAHADAGRLLLPGTEGRYAVAQWTATSAGVYHVFAQFSTASGAVPGPNDVHLQGDGRDITSGSLDPSGAQDRFCASLNLNLMAGAALEFAVGNAPGASASRATGLRASVCPQ